MLVAESLSQQYEGRPILKDFSYSFTPHLIHGIIGPNGAGKSTLLRLIAAMEPPLSGRVSYKGEALVRPNPEINCLWQRPYLFRATVAENIAYGLRIRRWARGDREARVAHLLEAFHLEALREQWAAGLSVGEAARVALARAMAPHPSVLILDEPTANLDPGNTRLVEEVLTAIQAAEGMTVVLVTHDMFQAKRVAQTTLFLADGQLVEAGPSSLVFASPASVRTNRFIHGEL